MPDLIKSAAEQREAEMKQIMGRANTKLQLSTQYVGVLLAKGNGLEFPPVAVANYALETAEAVLSGWEKDLDERTKNVPSGS